MHILLNGEERELPSGLTVTDLLHQLNMQVDQVAVEHNMKIVGRSELTGCTIHEGDRIEIISFMGGGERLKIRGNPYEMERQL